jgi:hypothetical protein
VDADLQPADRDDSGQAGRDHPAARRHRQRGRDQQPDPDRDHDDADSYADAVPDGGQGEYAGSHLDPDQVGGPDHDADEQAAVHAAGYDDEAADDDAVDALKHSVDALKHSVDDAEHVADDDAEHVADDDAEHVADDDANGPADDDADAGDDLHSDADGDPVHHTDRHADAVHHNGGEHGIDLGDALSRRARCQARLPSTCSGRVWRVR